MAWPAVNRHFTQEGFRTYVEALVWPKWRPSKIVWHNTAAPSLAQWIKSAEMDRSRGLVPGITRIGNLERYFRYDNNWPGCPHLFVANDFIWVMNPLTAPGTHSPSYNSTSIGIEMIGDYEREDDDAGDGLKVKNNTIFATALLCAELGFEPSDTILLHKQDPRTTHDCPGRDIAIDKFEMIASVNNLMSGGEHNPNDVADIIANVPLALPPKLWLGVTTVGDLNFRRGPGVANEATGSLPRGIKLEILGEARNGASRWLKVRTPAGFVGWVSGSYVEEVK